MIEPSLAAVTVFAVVQVVPFAVVLGLAIYWTVKDRSPAALLFLVGGLLCALIEPVVDGNAKVMFPEVGVIVWRAYGVPQPLWLVLAYVWFFGGQSMIVWRVLRQPGHEHKRSPRDAMEDVIRAAFLIALVDTALQVAGLYLNLFSYFGNQPLLIGRFPLWAPILDCSIPIVYVTLYLALEPYTKMWHRVVLAPVVQAGVNAAVSWPLYLGMHVEYPRAALVGALCLCGLSLGAVLVCADAAARRAR